MKSNELKKIIEQSAKSDASSVYIAAGDQKIHFGVTGATKSGQNILLHTTLDDEQLRRAFFGVVIESNEAKKEDASMANHGKPVLEKIYNDVINELPSGYDNPRLHNYIEDHKFLIAELVAVRYHRHMSARG